MDDCLAKIQSRAELPALLARWRAQRRRIVLTNGCFDVLHVGHARYLRQARALGDVLVVGVNTDASVQRLKGPTRPIVPEDERAELLASLACVDCVTLFDEATPNALVEVVRPHIHVKGGDYDPEAMPETPVVRRHGGEVVILPLVDGRSTTSIVERIQALATTTGRTES